MTEPVTRTPTPARSPDSSAAVTAIDGYQMARKGRAGPALAAAAIGSFFAGSVATFLLAAIHVALTVRFGPQATAACYEVNDRLPSGLAPLSREKTP